MSDEPDAPVAVQLKIKRQEHPDAFPRWDELEVTGPAGLTVLGALSALGPAPITRDGRTVTRPAWSKEATCADESCGACTMLVNGRVAQACSLRADEEVQPIELRPLTKFPLVCDLIVDRARLAADLARVGALPAVDESLAARCLACAACLEACPSYGPQARFVGAAVAHHARLAVGARPASAPAILDALDGPGGVSDCGHAQNCVAVCPAELPLTTSLAELMRDTTRRFFASLLGR
ncbi:MAG: 2Fe-2S iron-sulfur cluster-binding protein [Polyangia bacterium]